MKSSVLIAGVSAGVLLAAGSAAAGPCTGEIENLEKTLASTDAGMGPTGTGTETDTTIGAAPDTGTGTDPVPETGTDTATGVVPDTGTGTTTPSVPGATDETLAGQTDMTQPDLSPPDVSGPDSSPTDLSQTETGTTGTSGAAGTTEEHPPTDTMNQAAENKATSPEDVLQQNQGAPTGSDATGSDTTEAPATAEAPADATTGGAAEPGQVASAAGADEASDSLQRAKELDQIGDEAACMAEIAKAKSALGTQ